MKSSLKAGGSLLMLVGLGCALSARPAAAQDAASMKAIQAQIQQLQAELKKLQADAAKRDADVKKAQDEAAAAHSAAAAMAAARAAPTVGSLSVPTTALPGSAVVTIPPNDMDAAGKPVFNPSKPNGKFNLGGVTVSLGGFADVEVADRSRNTNGALPTPFTAIPYRDSPNYHTGELRAEAQNTRFAALAQGTPYDGALLSAYGEADFASAGISSTATQTNSYTLRLRQGYVQYDDLNYNVHVLAGQAWSFATPFKVGLTPRKEAIPYVIENNYTPGWFGDARQPQVRVAADVAPWAAVGASVEAPYSGFGGTKPTIVNGQLLTGSQVYTGTSPAVNTGTLATTGLNPTASYSFNTIPDLIVKGAIDPGFGHYEAFAIARFFTVEKNTTLSSSDISATGGGIGVNGLVPAVPGLVDVQGNIAAGYGIGRYGPAALPDATYKANGAPEPLPEVMASLGATLHALSNLDIFAFGGIEEESRRFSGTGTSAVGYGNPAFSNAGCNVEPENALSTTCSGNTNVRSVQGFQLGTWYTPFKGGFGTVQTGASYEYAERTSFKGAGGSPHTGDNIFLLAVRYFPFQ
jgi:hypothetical protein